jgi:hypothetical protein
MWAAAAGIMPNAYVTFRNRVCGILLSGRICVGTAIARADETVDGNRRSG